MFVRVRPLNAKEDCLVWIFSKSQICNHEGLIHLVLCCEKRTLLMFEIALWLTPPWELFAAKIKVSLTPKKLIPPSPNWLANLRKVHFAEPPRSFAFDGVLAEPNSKFDQNMPLHLFLNNGLRVCCVEFRSALQEDVFQLFGTNVADACLSGSAPHRSH